jgi:NADP-dependent 3-hydroxy acid dehydrogenase YdfG
VTTDRDPLPRRSGAARTANASDRLGSGSHNVFITGASSGIGAALARHYAARAANIGLFARRAEALATLANEIPA